MNIPSKFISRDGRTAWLCYSANFAFGNKRSDPNFGRPIGSKCAMSLHEIKIGRKPAPATITDTSDCRRGVMTDFSG